MSNVQKVEFGYYPWPIDLQVGAISIGTLPDFDDAVAALKVSENVDGRWIYAPQCSGRIAGRVFGLRKTHTLQHDASAGDEHLAFLIWGLSFFVGMRLTATEAGFLDATPITPATLVDFVVINGGFEQIVLSVEYFWNANMEVPQRCLWWSAAVHALFLGQNPKLLQFEQFLMLYAALDACFALAKSINPISKRIDHNERVAWMCQLFDMKTPGWARSELPSRSELSILRNEVIHEALYLKEPLGFAVQASNSTQNLNLELKALVCRFLVALIGSEQSTYVRSPIDTRQIFGLELTGKFI